MAFLILRWSNAKEAQVLSSAEVYRACRPRSKPRQRSPKSHSHLIRVRASPWFLVPEVNFLHWRRLHYTPRIQTCRPTAVTGAALLTLRLNALSALHTPTPSLQCSETAMLSKESLSTRLLGSSKVSAMWED